jgi:outer membrane protein OmpU
MNNFKKIGLTALAGSLIASSAFAASMSVTGGADIALKNESNADTGNGFSSGDSLNFSASGELDNGMVITSNLEVDGSVMDDRSVVIAFPEMGTLTFQTSGSTAMGAVGDMSPSAWDKSWDVIGNSTAATATGQALKATDIGGYGQANEFSYVAPELVEGLGVTVSYTPSNKGTTAALARPDGTTSFALAYTGIEGLTVGYAEEDNGKTGTSKIDADTMYATYAFGSFTVGVQSSEADGGNANDDDEFSSHGITYQVTDDLTIGYHASEYQFGDKTADQETKSVQAAYTMGGMTLKAQSVSMDNVGGSTAARDDIDGYKFSVSFAF